MAAGLFLCTRMSETATVQPTPAPAPMSFKDHIAFESRSPEPEPQPAPPPAEPVVETTPEQEADSPKPDADLSEAAKLLRRNRLDERTKRIKDQNDQLARELQRRAELRSEFERVAPAQPRTADGTASAGNTPQATVGAGPTGTTFTFPDFVSWAVGANADQPYEAYLDARDTARDQWKETQIRERVAREQRARVADEQAQKLEAMHVTGRTKYSDFDAAVEPLLRGLVDNPRGPIVAEFLVESEHGMDLVYHLGTHADALEGILTAKTPAALTRALARLEAQVTLPKPAAKPVTSTPAPPSRTVGGGSTASEPDTTKGTVSTKEHYRIEEAELAEQRRRRRA